MPVEGFPLILESMLNSALQESTVSSFKIEGRGNQTVVILRLRPIISTRPPVDQERSGAFRRKCPSQVTRDRRRAEAHRTRQENQASENSPSDLFLPTPPSLFYDTEQENNAVVRNADLFSYSPCIPSASVSSSGVQQDEQGVQMMQCATDSQTVTLRIDGDTCDKVSCADEGVVDLCKSGTPDCVEGESVAGAECVDSETDCAGTIEQESDFCKPQETTLVSGVTNSDIMALIVKTFSEQYQKHVDDIRCTIREVKTACKDVKEGNPNKDVT